jgi:hypothetical protein
LGNHTIHDVPNRYLGNFGIQLTFTGIQVLLPVKESHKLFGINVEGLRQDLMDTLSSLMYLKQLSVQINRAETITMGYKGFRDRNATNARDRVTCHSWYYEFPKPRVINSVAIICSERRGYRDIWHGTRQLSNDIFFVNLI